MLRPYGSMQISSCLLPHLSEHVIITMTVHCGSLYILVPHYFTLPWTGTRSNDLIDSQTMSRSWLGCGSGRRVCSTTSRSSWESTWTLLNMLAVSAAFSSVLGLFYVKTWKIWTILYFKPAEFSLFRVKPKPAFSRGFKHHPNLRHATGRN